MNRPNLRELRALAREASARGQSHPASVHAQITGRNAGNTASGDPYIELSFADSTATEKLRIWKETPAFRTLEDFPQMTKGTCIEVNAKWRVNHFGLVGESSELRALDGPETERLFASESSMVQVEEDWQFLQSVFNAQTAGPLRGLAEVCSHAMENHRDAFRRAAAAHGIHHARRGGLLEHTASMMRVAVNLCAGNCYPEVEPLILYAGILFHDLGKIHETDYQPRGFMLAPTHWGVLVGHICAGLDMFRLEWECFHHSGETWLRDYVAHCIVAHHGQKEWGSPVEPATPEAVLLHHIDMIDAGIEKLRKAYRDPEAVCPGLIAAVYPMRGSVAIPFAATDLAARLWLQHYLNSAPDRLDFCSALVVCGITSELRTFDELTRETIETGVRRWDELFRHMPSLPEQAPSRGKVTFP
jgi:3'-5' exoribonuclease